MDSITLQNYRCFGSEEQTARLAQLTLLVGPNSTGKTSFLALIRALWDVAFREVVPNFREEPFDLGSWEDVAYRPAARGKSPDTLTGAFGYGAGNDVIQAAEFSVVFQSLESFPFPTTRSIKEDDQEVQLITRHDGTHAACFRQGVSENEQPLPQIPGDDLRLFPFHYLADLTGFWEVELGAWKFQPLIRSLQVVGFDSQRPFADAPIRSQPHRTYDPTQIYRDPEGKYVPAYLAGLVRHNADEWQLLKTRLKRFGVESELFDEIQVRSFGTSDGDPFQIHVRKHSGRKYRPRKGPWRNLIDVGYGVSQVLPVLTELLRPDGPTMFLLQQPEVHLHPQAQAALGTLFCQVAAGGRQLVVETHSDYIIDRVRMDVRDGKTDLKAGDVSILYFEPRDLDVKIHSIRLDEMGNVLDAPPGYRKFFMEEIRRSIGL